MIVNIDHSKEIIKVSKVLGGNLIGNSSLNIFETNYDELYEVNLSYNIPVNFEYIDTLVYSGTNYNFNLRLKNKLTNTIFHIFSNSDFLNKKIKVPPNCILLYVTGYNHSPVPYSIIAKGEVNSP